MDPKEVPGAFRESISVHFISPKDPRSPVTPATLGDGKPGKAQLKRSHLAWQILFPPMPATHWNSSTRFQLEFQITISHEGWAMIMRGQLDAYDTIRHDTACIQSTRVSVSNAVSCYTGPHRPQAK
jgi:hypothetical protein